MAVGKFSFYRSFDEAARDLPDADRLRLYDAMSDYVFRGVYPDFEGVLGIVWKLVRPNLDSSVRGQETGGKRKGRASDGTYEGASDDGSGARTEGASEGTVGNGVAKPSKGGVQREMIRKREERKGKERETRGRAGADSAPPALCPLCEVPMRKNTNSGRWECPSCHDTWSSDQAVWR